MPKLSRNIWLSSKDYVFIVLGLCIYAFGFTAFVLPEKVVIGGLVGVGSLVYFLTDIPVAITSYACNLLLLAIAYRIVGRQFVVRTVFGATVLNPVNGLAFGCSFMCRPPLPAPGCRPVRAAHSPANVYEHHHRRCPLRSGHWSGIYP